VPASRRGHPVHDHAGRAVGLLFALTTWLGAALLFVVEPMVGKALLPALGGAPAVWGTCLVFFQVALLAGYAWAHLVASRVPLCAQPLVHGLLVAAAFASLPLHAPAGAPPAQQAFPVPWLVGRLSATVGLPFVAVSATSPLVQRWFAAARRDPYFLYAASNAGSLVALLAYPVIIEPRFTLGAQRALWSRGFELLAVLLAGCAVVIPLRRREPAARSSVGARRPGGRLLVRWLALAAVPSALLLGVTAFVTTDVAPVPLLWVVPLALYLASLIVPFSARPLVGHERVLRAMPAAALVLAFTLVVEAEPLLWLVAPLHFAAFFVVALACHGELARRKPPPERLTTFYLVVAAGGALGAALVALVAPLVFPSVWEYPLAIVAACALRIGMPAPGGVEPREDFETLARAEGFGAGGLLPPRVRKTLRIVGAPLATMALLAAAGNALARTQGPWRVFVLAQIATAACVVAWSWRSRPWRFTTMVAAMVSAPALASLAPGMLFEGRSFFGVHRVVEDRAAARRLYMQGTTIHGLQSTLPARRRIAGAYFHRTGPAGDVLTRVAPARAGLVGLGVASLAAYADAGQTYTFFEIDPLVARIAGDPHLFTFLSDARDRGARVDVVLGDARLRLARVPDAAFDLLVIDAYSSDVVPTHLLTREAFALYFRKVAPHGLVLMNVSNRYLDLGRVVRAVGDADGLAARARDDESSDPRDGKAPSRWIVVARAQADIDALGLPEPWKPLPPTSMRAWTDDYVDLPGALRF
jgi:hypothetical protein